MSYRNEEFLMASALISSIQTDFDGPKPYTMPDYEYLQRSNRSDFAKLRAYWNGVFARCKLSRQLKHDIRSRFRSKINANHFGALFELFMYEFLTCADFAIEEHPKLPGGNPDYEVTSIGGFSFYLEATCLFGDKKESSEDRLYEKICDAINTIESRQFKACIRIEGEPNGEMKIAKLKYQVEQWLLQLDYDHLLSVQNVHDSYIDNRHHFGASFEIAGATLHIDPIAIDPPGSSCSGRFVMMHSFGGVRRITTGEDIYKKLKRKSPQVKGADLPVVMAINVLASSMDMDDILDALFGQRQYILSFGKAPPQVIGVQRGPGGTWIHKGKTQNTTISAVLIFSNVRHNVCPTRKPILIFNPYVEDVDIPINLPYVERIKFDKNVAVRESLPNLADVPKSDNWNDVWPFGVKGL